ncbi:MAG: hypothetical protein ACYCPO_14175 [Acidobacteriaceae bacterium]
MLKILAILAVLLAMVQIPNPLPGQATTRPGNGSGKANGNSHNNNPPTDPLVPIVSQAHAPENSKHASEVAAEKGEHSVTLTSVPPLTITARKKIFLDYVYEWGPWFFGLFLAIAGGVQLWLLRVTWKAIREQKTEMAIQTGILKISVAAAKDSAKAANDQIEMMKGKERARIQIIPLNFEVIEPTEPNKIMIEFVNIEPTNAFDVRVEAGGKITVDGLNPEQGEYTDLAIPTLLRPDKPESSWVVCDFPQRWQNQIVDDRARITVELIGKIKYRDVFDAIQIDDFSYRMNVYGIENMPRNFVRLKLMREWHPFDPHPGDWEF